ncbi:Dyp-type peroxidase [uncultured Jatrophihabitans sp.]|uniref:Dyp-type peroxidase n=1 Tax=uncultured Jatrophihabitans sp. TaxID=1610747 RepID=UPI0035CBE5FD
MTQAGPDRVPFAAQTIEATLSPFAEFVVLKIGPREEDLEATRAALADVPDLLKTVGFRDLSARLTCVVGIGSAAWSRLAPGRAPAELRPFEAIVGPKHTAVSTPGDLLLHVRAERADLCFEFVRLLTASLGDAVTVEDDTSCFRYFDARDLLGFVDGTANPVGADAAASALVGDDDPGFAGGSYVVVQKYLHDLDAWGQLGEDEQARIVGRRKSDNVELPDAEFGQKSHKTLATIEDDDGEHDILRDNMPFGRAAHGEFGTYFVGYSGRAWVTLEMLRRMFLGDPPGLSDRILDVSHAVTGALFFAPSAALLETITTAR